MFSVSKARGRICVLKNPTAKILLSLFNIMLVYGHDPIPAVECRRCGVYPVDETPPPFSVRKVTRIYFQPIIVDGDHTAVLRRH